ncbi:uncharacterized protein TNCV_1672281 [Trichonephila clavipes]|nr:uncharacterized protein TNCV_1672281 [Trichonephila clavipes]
MGTRLLDLKSETGREKLSDGECLSGRNRLTDILISKIKRYYSMAIRNIIIDLGSLFSSSVFKREPSPWTVSRGTKNAAVVAKWSRYRIVAGLVTSSSPLKTRRVGKRCTLNLPRAQASSRWCGVVVRRGMCQLRCRPRHLSMVQNDVVRRQKPSCCWTQCDVNIHSLPTPAVSLLRPMA